MIKYKKNPLHIGRGFFYLLHSELHNEFALVLYEWRGVF